MNQPTTSNALERILAHAISIIASDVHIAEDEHIAFRVHGELARFGQAEPVTHEIINLLVAQLFKNDAARIEDFHKRRDVDFAYISQDGTPFRVNGFYKLGKIGFVMRRIERNAKKMEALGLPSGVTKILTAKQGLFLIT